MTWGEKLRNFFLNSKGESFPLPPRGRNKHYFILCREADKQKSVVFTDDLSEVNCDTCLHAFGCREWKCKRCKGMGVRHAPRAKD